MAQTAGFPGLPEGTTLSLGGGAVASPSYLGARGMEVSPAPSFSAEIGRDVSIDAADGIRYTVLRAGGFSLGPIARYRPGRSRGSLPMRLRGLGGIADAGELGGFAAYEAGPAALDLIGTRDIGGYGGALMEARATLSIPFGDPASQQGIVVGPFVKVGNRAFLQKNLGVDAKQAAATGLAVSQPGGGLYMAGLEANAAVGLSDHWSLRGTASWGRLTGDAGSSSLVRDGGRRDQTSGGLFLVLTP